MPLTATQLSILLAEEREAAKSADLERLAELQAAKRTVVASFDADPPTEEEQRTLAITARENLVLLRHLTAMLQALAGAALP